MTIDDLVRIAWNTYDNQHTEWDAMRAAVLAVLDAGSDAYEAEYNAARGITQR